MDLVFTVSFIQLMVLSLVMNSELMLQLIKINMDRRLPRYKLWYPKLAIAMTLSSSCGIHRVILLEEDYLIGQR